MVNRRSIIMGTVCFALMMVVAVFVGRACYRFVYQPITVHPGESVIIRIDKTTTATRLAQLMHAQGWIGSARLWVGWMRLQGMSSKLKAGVYQLQSAESAQHLLQRICAGDVLRQLFLIKPGTTQAQIIADLKNAPFLTYTDDDWQVLDDATLNASHPTQLNQAYEGMLLADSYSYDAGSRANELIRMAHAHLQTALKQAWDSRHLALPYQSPYELLIAASIIEKESALPAERRLISGVIVNRLHKHMPLQMDPTVIYALGPSYKGSLSHEQLSIDSPYNTYQYRGLPPTPIAAVSRDALNAARDPDTQGYLYFVAKGDGSHAFSLNYLAHRQAIQRYRSKH